MKKKKVVYCYKNLVKDLEDLSKIDKVRKILRRRILKFCTFNKFMVYRFKGDKNLIKAVSRSMREPCFTIFGPKKKKDISISITIGG